ncbi:MAG: antitoxin [Actinomycetota bacterium]
MRTTVTLDPDSEALIRKRMQARGTSFKQTLNEVIREGLGAAPAPGGFRTSTANLGLPCVNLDRALQLAAVLEDDELIRKMRLGK